MGFSSDPLFCEKDITLLEEFAAANACFAARDAVEQHRQKHGCRPRVREPKER